MDVVINKIDSISRCINRINEEFNNNVENLYNQTKQDSIILNLQRACELSIDLANSFISRYNLETPKTSRDSFEILFNHSIISKNIFLKMQKMVGFRNIAIHDYKKLDLEILKSILKNNLSDFKNYSDELINYFKKYHNS